MAGLFRKLEFEGELFRKAHHADPPDIDGIVYGCLNFILTAHSLREWLEKELRDRGGTDLADFQASIGDRLPKQSLCSEIANTLKHKDFRDGRWPGGSVKLDYLPDTDGQGRALAVLVFDQGEQLNISALELIEVVTAEWRFLLMDYGIIERA